MRWLLSILMLASLSILGATPFPASDFRATHFRTLLAHGMPRYDFTARFTQPSTGNHFRSIDSNAETYTWLSPYTFCAGDPINKTDPSGRLVIFVNGFTGSEGGQSKYWEGVDDFFTNLMHDTNTMYFNGSAPFYSSAKTRYQNGYNTGLNESETILKSAENEQITFVTHSMGAAYAKGMIDSLLGAAIELGMIDDVENQNLIKL